MKKEIQLSFSKLSNYEQCPRQFQSKYITKTYPDDSDNPHFAKGNRIHKQLENYVKFLHGDEPEPDMGKESSNAIPMIESIFKNYEVVYPEQQVSVDKDFNKVEWFDRSTYYRAIFDLIATKGSEGLLVDWKSGKVRDYDEKPTGQLHLAAAMLFSIQPQLETVTTVYVFVEHKHSIKRTFHRKDLDSMIEPFHEAYRTVNADTEFTPTVHKYCYFCNIQPEDCEFKK